MKYSEDIMDSKATYQGRIAELPSSSELELLLSHRSFSILNVFTRTGERKKTKKNTRPIFSPGKEKWWNRLVGEKWQRSLYGRATFPPPSAKQSKAGEGWDGSQLSLLAKKKKNWQNTPCDEYFTRLQQWRGSPTVQDGCCRSDWRRCINMSGAELWVCLFGCISAA